MLQLLCIAGAILAVTGILYLISLKKADLRQVRNWVDYQVYHFRRCVGAGPKYWLHTLLVLGDWISYVGVIQFLLRAVTFLVNPGKGFVPDGIDASLIYDLVCFVYQAGRYVTTRGKQPAIATNDELYRDVQPQGPAWRRMDLVPRAKKVAWLCESVYMNPAVDRWLRSDQPIPISRDRDYEKQLRREISNPDRWGNTFSRFLKRNAVDARKNGKSFYNETKYGLSRDLDPKAGAAAVHKTCYFDSYLTNIIPGRCLTVDENDEDPEVKTEDLMPYVTLAGDERRLREIATDMYRANEPGVSTIFLSGGTFYLWRQNEHAQGSPGLIAPSGSGSVDWKDCKPFLEDPDGFRKSIVYGMQRELWEEGYSTRKEISLDKFMEETETRIIGYYRWLQKAGKPEFIGITRVKPGIRSKAEREPSPQAGEVKSPEPFGAGTVAELRKTRPLLTLVSPDGQRVETADYSVPCVMAVHYLRGLCEEYCAACPHRTAGDSAMPCEHCPVDPTEALFPEGTAISVK